MPYRSSAASSIKRASVDSRVYMAGRGRVPTLAAGAVKLQQLRRRDARAWSSVQSANQEWLRPWDATIPPESREVLPTFRQMASRLRVEARSGRTLPYAIWFRRQLVGQVTVSGISGGSLRAAHIGYWIDQRFAGLGIMPSSVALTSRYCLEELGLHRLEIAICPENSRSLRVVEKLGFRPEGIREKYLHINGQWRDHAIFVLRAEEAHAAALSQWCSRHEEVA
jgi:[ribosomal protein S5]-alanine N-acetyltransferase